jgi:hypothetical protein
MVHPFSGHVSVRLGRSGETGGWARNWLRPDEAGRVHAPADPQPQLPRPTVFKAFMGSDTTLIAAETTGRVCFGL